MIPRGEAIRAPGIKILDTLKAAARPHIEKAKSLVDYPDAIGKSEKYFATLSRPEKRQFLIEEVLEASKVLTDLSFDFEENLDFYNRAPDDVLKNHILNIVFPEQSRVEKPLETTMRVVKELHSGRPEKPNPRTGTGAGEQWRRRVILAIDVLLHERRKMMEIEEYWDNPIDESREEFRKQVFLGQKIQGDPEVTFTPFALIIALDENDYNQVTSRLTPDKATAQGTAGMALVEHVKLPQLSGKVIFMRKVSDIGEKNFNAFRRHELFHLYFHNFIRKQNLSKVHENYYTIQKMKSAQDAKVKTHQLTESLRSILMEETSAYLFNTESRIQTDQAHGFLWESHIQQLYENLDGEELQIALTDVRKEQARYLYDARRLQSSLLQLFEAVAKDNEKKNPPLSEEELRRNFLFFISQWGPQRMNQLLERLRPDFIVEKALQFAQEDPSYQTLDARGKKSLIEHYIPQASLHKEQELKQRLQKNVSKLLNEFILNKLTSANQSLMEKVMLKSSWLYADDDLLSFIKLSSQIVKKTTSTRHHHQLIRIVENSMVVREQPLSQSEVIALRKLISTLQMQGDARLKQDAKVLQRYLKEYSEKI